MGRPKLQIDEEQVARMARLGCTVEEMAEILDCNVRTLQRRFAGVMKSNRGRLKKTVRRWQLRLAKRGNAIMLIWLGKQLLGQRDMKDDPAEVATAPRPIMLAPKPEQPQDGV